MKQSSGETRREIAKACLQPHAQRQRTDQPFDDEEADSGDVTECQLMSVSLRAATMATQGRRSND